MASAVNCFSGTNNNFCQQVKSWKNQMRFIVLHTAVTQAALNQHSTHSRTIGFLKMVYDILQTLGATSQ